jgi:hypothetical protein
VNPSVVAPTVNRCSTPVGPYVEEKNRSARTYVSVYAQYAGIWSGRNCT